MESQHESATTTECEDENVFDAVKCTLCAKSCVTRDIGFKLRDYGMRFTRQRIELARLLFGNGDRHFTADMLHSDARQANIPVSLATIYNTLQHFAKVGLIRRLSTGGQKAWFDTNVAEHHHLYNEDESLITDVPKGYLSVADLPPVPDDMEIERVDVVVHLRRRDGAKSSGQPSPETIVNLSGAD